MSISNQQTGQGLSRRKKHEQQQQIVPINAQHTTTNFNLLAQQQQIALMNVHGGLHAQQQQSSLMYSHHSNIYSCTTPTIAFEYATDKYWFSYVVATANGIYECWCLCEPASNGIDEYTANEFWNYQ